MSEQRIENGGDQPLNAGYQASGTNKPLSQLPQGESGESKIEHSGYQPSKEFKLSGQPGDELDELKATAKISENKDEMMEKMCKENVAVKTENEQLRKENEQLKKQLEHVAKERERLFHLFRGIDSMLKVF